MKKEEVLRFNVPFFNDNCETESEDEKKDDFKSMDEDSEVEEGE